LITRFPDSPRIPDAMLNLGIAQIDAGDKRAARSTFQAIIEKYPETQAAQPARERLSTLR
jgi:TolA-binding protein